MAVVSAITLTCTSLVAIPSFAVETTVGTATELTTAITNAATGDSIRLTSDIVVPSVVTVSKAITIDGAGYSVSVPKPGVTDSGANNSSASSFGVFSLSGSFTITLKNMKIKGGNVQGAGVKVGSGTTAVLDGVTISNSRYASGGGGGIYNGGTTYLKNSNLMRNSAMYGGGFLNPSGKSMYVINSTVTDNRSESSAGGGGGAENQGTLYINNSTFSNNSSTEIGGAVNNYYGTLYVSGSSFTGNVAYGSYGGGALGRNGGTISVVSSLFAYNYSRASGSTASPTTFNLDDVGITARSITTGAGVTLRYSTYHASATSATIGSTNTQYNKAADGSDNALFTGGSLGKVRDGTGAEIGTGLIYRPFIVSRNGRFAPALGSASLAGQKGTPVRFDVATGNTSYYDRSAGSPAWVNLTGSAATTSVTLDQYGENRNSSFPATGAVEIELTNLYQVRAVQSSGGTVNGASVYGDVYAANTRITVTAVPDAGQKFDHFTVSTSATTLNSSAYEAVVDIPVTTNPLVYNVTADAIVTPVFVAAAAGERTVSYAANEATCGQPPTTVTSASSIVVAGNTTSSPLQREGYVFSGWNSEPNGSGTDYAAGSTYSTASNLSLAAKWVASPGTVTTCFTVVTPPSSNPSSSPSVTPAPTPSGPVSSNTQTDAAPVLTRTPSSASVPTATPKPSTPVATPSQTLAEVTQADVKREVQLTSLIWPLLLAVALGLAIFVFFYFLRRSRKDEEGS